MNLRIFHNKQFGMVFLQAESKWAYIDDEDAKAKMRDVFENLEKWESMANELKDSYQGEQYWFDKFIEELSIDVEIQDEEEFLL
jgi:hypothetical protein